MTASGRTPCSSHTAARDTIIANSAGCRTSTRSRPAPVRSAASRSRSTCRRRAAAQSAILAANTGLSASRSRAMPGHCAPCPGNTRTVRASGSTTPVTTDGVGREEASARSPAWSPSRSAPRTTARRSRAARRVSSPWATSVTSTSSSVSRRARRPACSVSAAPDRAESSSGGAAVDGPMSGAGSGRPGSSGACSRMTWALVPLTPKDDTAPRRGASPVQSLASVRSSTAPAVQSTCPVGRSTCRVLGIRACRIACTTLIRPATPAAACEWPRFDLTEPNHNGASRSLP